MMQFLKRFKFLYAGYNFFHKKELVHNISKLKKAGLSKKYYQSISSRDFKGLPGSMPGDIATDRTALEKDGLFRSLKKDDQQSLLSFDANGFAVITNYLNAGKVDEVNREIETLLGEKKIAITNRNKIMFAIHVSRQLWEIGDDPKLKDLLSVLMGGKAVLFQSINFLTGSEQHTHSDSIHMTTYPLGGLLGVWIALEDITIDNGPLHYYPGSHKLPYYLNADYDNEGNAVLLGKRSYTEYEKMIDEKISGMGLQKVRFFAKKGDLLIWHANLFHGGDPHTDKSKTRKSMVLHYFNEEAICYHEITQRPALIRAASFGDNG